MTRRQMMTKKRKVKLNKKESEDILPIIQKFNEITGAVVGLLSKRVERKERKISVLVSQIKKPDKNSSQIKVETVEFSKGFLREQRKKKKKDGDSEWDDRFTEKRGFLI